MSHTRLTATVYSATGCRQCVSTFIALERYGFDYTVIDVDTNEAARRHITETLGYNQLPVVEAAGDAWSGFRPDRLKTIAKESVVIGSCVMRTCQRDPKREAARLAPRQTPRAA